MLGNLAVNRLGAGAVLNRCDVYSDCASAPLLVAGLDTIKEILTQQEASAPWICLIKRCQVNDCCSAIWRCTATAEVAMLYDRRSADSAVFRAGTAMAD